MRFKLGEAAVRSAILLVLGRLCLQRHLSDIASAIENPPIEKVPMQ